MRAGSSRWRRTLGVEYGELVTLHAEEEGANAALDELAAMLARELDE